MQGYADTEDDLIERVNRQIGQRMLPNARPVGINDIPLQQQAGLPLGPIPMKQPMQRQIPAQMQSLRMGGGVPLGKPMAGMEDVVKQVAAAPAQPEGDNSDALIQTLLETYLSPSAPLGRSGVDATILPRRR